MLLVYSKVRQVEKLKSLFPQVVKDGEIDFDALKLALGGETGDTGSRLSYGLAWAGKKIKKEVGDFITSQKKNPKLFEDENLKSKIN